MQCHVRCQIAECRDRWHQMTFWVFAFFCILFTLVVEWPAQANWQVRNYRNCSAPDFLALAFCRHAVHPSTCSHWPCMGGIFFPSGMQWEHWFCHRRNGHSHNDHHDDHDDDHDHDQHFYNCGGMIGHFWDCEFVINTSSCRVKAVTLQKHAKGKLDPVTLGWFFRFFKRQHTVISSNPHAITSATGGEKLRKMQCWHTTKPAYLQRCTPSSEGQPDQSDILEYPTALASKWKRINQIHFLSERIFRRFEMKTSTQGPSSI